MKQKPVATVIREVLTEAGLWRKGRSTTYQDTYYSKREMTKRWTSKYSNGCTPKKAKQLTSTLRERLTSEGYNFDSASIVTFKNPLVNWVEAEVYVSTPIKITEL